MEESHPAHPGRLPLHTSASSSLLAVALHTHQLHSPSLFRDFGPIFYMDAKRHPTNEDSEPDAKHRPSEAISEHGASLRGVGASGNSEPSATEGGDEAFVPSVLQVEYYSDRLVGVWGQMRSLITIQYNVEYSLIVKKWCMRETLSCSVRGGSHTSAPGAKNPLQQSIYIHTFLFYTHFPIPSLMSIHTLTSTRQTQARRQWHGGAFCRCSLSAPLLEGSAL